MDAVDVADLIKEDYQQRGTNIFVRCYNTEAHKNGDTKPSLCIYDGDRGYHCYACGESGSHSWLFRQFNVEVPGVTDQYRKRDRAIDTPAKPERTRTPKTYKTYPLMELYSKMDELPKQTHKVLESKGFTPGDFGKTAGWRWYVPTAIKGWRKGIFIPYFDVDGKELVGGRIRYLSGDVRFNSLPEAESFPYMWHNLKKPVVFVTEGETDCLTLMFNGIPAVGIPGSTNAEAINKLMKEAKKYNTQLILVPDQDDAGHKFLERLRLAAFEHFVPIDNIELPHPYKDVNDFWTGSDPDLFVSFFTNEMPETEIVAIPQLTQERLI